MTWSELKDVLSQMKRKELGLFFPFRTGNATKLAFPHRENVTVLNLVPVEINFQTSHLLPFLVMLFLIWKGSEFRSILKASSSPTPDRT